MRRNPQVNCTDSNCYYNVDNKCYRAGIHAGRHSCGCYVVTTGHIPIVTEEDR